MIIGFIGTGKMGEALARAAAKNSDNTLLLANRHPEKAEKLVSEIGGSANTAAAVAAAADFIFLGVKPGMLSELAGQIKDALSARAGRFVIVSMLAGTEMNRISEALGLDCPIIRIMPNIPVSVGEGAVLYAANAAATAEDIEAFLSAMKFSGRFYATEERLIDAGSAVSGCGPAFAAMFIEALADGGVACGLPRAAALEYAAQMAAGSAKLILDGGVSPAELKDAVCSPGGTTIQGVRALEESAFRGAAMDAVIAAYEKTIGKI